MSVVARRRDPARTRRRCTRLRLVQLIAAPRKPIVSPVPSRTTRATRSGSSHVGTWPQSGSSTCRTRFGSAPSAERPRADDMVELGPGEGHRHLHIVQRTDLAGPHQVARPRIGRGGDIGTSHALRLGRAEPFRVMDEAAKRSAAPRRRRHHRTERGQQGPSGLAARFSRLLLFSGARLQNPAVQTPTTELARSWRAHSIATQPPREIPATCGRSSPSESWNASTAAARFAALGSIPSGSGGDSPKPGMSTATTSRSAASRSSTGDHWTSEPPSEWSSRSGSPPPCGRG